MDKKIERIMSELRREGYNVVARSNDVTISKNGELLGLIINKTIEYSDGIVEGLYRPIYTDKDNTVPLSKELYDFMDFRMCIE